MQVVREIKNIKEMKPKKVQFQKSGSGSVNAKISLPMSWIKKMGITEDDKMISVMLTEDNKVLIEKE